MTEKMILAPMFALIGVTAAVWMTMLVKRAIRMQQAGLKPQDMPDRVLADAKFGDAQAGNNALMNLFELPVAFYVLSIVVLVLSKADWLFLAGAWAYVVLRALQAFIHVTYNNVPHRGGAYLLSSTLLWLMWARLAGQLYLGTP